MMSHSSRAPMTAIPSMRKRSGHPGLGLPEWLTSAVGTSAGITDAWRCSAQPPGHRGCPAAGGAWSIDAHTFNRTAGRPGSCRHLTGWRSTDGVAAGGHRGRRSAA